MSAILRVVRVPLEECHSKRGVKATLPTVAHPGEDLAYDVYALEQTTIPRIQGGNCCPAEIRTGIAATAFKNGIPLGMIIKDRSSMAKKGLSVVGGVIDAGYTGEIVVLMRSHGGPYEIEAGDKIAQLVPVPVLTGLVEEVNSLTESARGVKGFGSSGK